MAVITKTVTDKTGVAWEVAPSVVGPALRRHFKAKEASDWVFLTCSLNHRERVFPYRYHAGETLTDLVVRAESDIKGASYFYLGGMPPHVSCLTTADLILLTGSLGIDDIPVSTVAVFSTPYTPNTWVWVTTSIPAEGDGKCLLRGLMKVGITRTLPQLPNTVYTGEIVTPFRREQLGLGFSIQHTVFLGDLLLQDLTKDVYTYLEGQM